MTSRLLLIALLAGTCSGEDVILLTNGQRLRGTVDTQATPVPGMVAVLTSNGLVRLRQELIGHIEESYETRLARANDDDPAGLYELAQWCVTKDMAKEALEILARCLRHPLPPVEARGLYADLVDLSGDTEKALGLLRSYRDAGGKNPKLLARLKQLEDFVQSQESPAAPALVEKPAAVLDGLEMNGWSAESNQWSNPVKADVQTLTDERGTNQVIDVAFEKGDKDKAAVRRAMRGLSLGENDELVFWVYNRTEADLSFAVALKTGNWVFHETRQMKIPKGAEWRQVRVPLRGSDWKSQASDWAYTAAVSELSDLKELQFLVYGNSTGSLLIDAIEFGKGQGL